jgi:hypothetical protein
MEYNTQRQKLIIPEYGRNVQKMIDQAVMIEDKDKRTRAAYAIVGIMSQINPGVKDSVDYQRTLWDHMHIISDFRLEVDGPFPPPTEEQLAMKPDRVEYSDGRIKYRHYGKNIEGIIDKAIEFEDGPEKDALIHVIANHLKKSYLNWNRDSVDDDTILHHLSELSGGKLKMEEDTKLTATGEILARSKVKKKKYQQRGKEGNHKKRGYGGKNF